MTPAPAAGASERVWSAGRTTARPTAAAPPNQAARATNRKP
jgi:hypothetical protein